VRRQSAASPAMNHPRDDNKSPAKIPGFTFFLRRAHHPRSMVQSGARLCIVKFVRRT
jgi:hypothetical protein